MRPRNISRSASKLAIILTLELSLIGNSNLESTSTMAKDITN